MRRSMATRRPSPGGSDIPERADRERFAAPVGAHLLRAHLFGYGAARADHRARRAAGPQGAARHLARAESRREPPRDRGGAAARPPASRRGQGVHRRQRGAAQGRAARRGDQGATGGGEAALGPPRHLCRCLGVLAQVARACLGGRLHHHPHPALLGGRSGRAPRTRSPMCGRSGRSFRPRSPARRS